MKKSLFNITQPYKDDVLLYNTFTTSMLQMDPDMYQKIFDEERYEQFPMETKELLSLGFLIDDATDELEEQEKYRQTVIDNNSDKIANIIIAPTLECNAHCFYCFENGHRKGMMSRQTADAVVEHLTKVWNGKLLGITWFGGEPLLAVDIIEYIISGLKKNSINFSSKITTNGSLLTGENIKKIKKNWNVEKIQITVDALGEQYNAIKNYHDLDDAFSTVITNITNALNAGLKIKIRINFNPEQKDTAIETMEFFNEKFNQYDNLKVYFAPIDEDEHVVKNVNNVFSTEKEHPYISLIKYGRQHGLYRGFPDMEDDEKHESYDDFGLLKKLKIYPSTTNCYATCPSVYSIDCYGDIYKCHRVLGRKEYVSGNVFSGIEQNDPYKFFCNTKLTYDECKSCPILPICQGGCKVNARLYQGKEACAPTKTIIKELILLYKEDLDKTF